MVINEVNCTLQVEIKCRGQPVLGNLPLEKVQNIWLATTTSFELLPALKQLNIAARENRNWPQFMSRPADDCVMVLTYSRKFWQIHGPWILQCLKLHPVYDLAMFEVQIPCTRKQWSWLSQIFDWSVLLSYVGTNPLQALPVCMLNLDVFNFFIE